jgi:hypothetical protein
VVDILSGKVGNQSSDFDARRLDKGRLLISEHVVHKLESVRSLQSRSPCYFKLCLLFSVYSNSLFSACIVLLSGCDKGGGLRIFELTHINKKLRRDDKW